MGVYNYIVEGFFKGYRCCRHHCHTLLILIVVFSSCTPRTTLCPVRSSGRTRRSPCRNGEILFSCGIACSFSASVPAVPLSSALGPVLLRSPSSFSFFQPSSCSRPRRTLWVYLPSRGNCSTTETCFPCPGRCSFCNSGFPPQGSDSVCLSVLGSSSSRILYFY